MHQQQLLAAGPIDQAVSLWLIEHGAVITTVSVLNTTVNLITLPLTAIIEEDGQWWRWIISFYGPDGNYENMYIEVERSGIDTLQTTLTLRSRIQRKEEETRLIEGQKTRASSLVAPYPYLKLEHITRGGQEQSYQYDLLDTRSDPPFYCFSDAYLEDLVSLIKEYLDITVDPTPEQLDAAYTGLVKLLGEGGPYLFFLEHNQEEINSLLERIDGSIDDLRACLIFLHAEGSIALTKIDEDDPRVLKQFPTSNAWEVTILPTATSHARQYE